MTLQIAVRPVSGQPGLFAARTSSLGEIGGLFGELGDVPEPQDVFLDLARDTRRSGLSGLGSSGLPVPRMKDFVSAADSVFYALSAADKQKYGTVENFWKAWGKDNRITSRATFAALKAEKPNATPAEASKWWVSIGKKRRQSLRRKYSPGYGDDIFSDIVGAAGKAVKSVADVVTLAPLIAKIPVLGKIHAEIYGATTKLNMLPFKAVEQLVDGKRIDKIALGQFKEALASAKTLAPYVQTVVALVPGVGTGLSAGLGAGLALASGRSIDQALLEGVRGALPGGALAQAAFDVAAAAAQGKPIEQVVLNALPVSASAKDALIRGSKAVRALAEGKRVDQVIIDQAVAALPPAAQKAAQIGVALAQAKNLQQGMKIAARGAASAAGAALPDAVNKLAKQLPKGVALPKMPDIARLAKQGSPIAKDLLKKTQRIAAIQKAAQQNAGKLSTTLKQLAQNKKSANALKKIAFKKGAERKKATASKATALQKQAQKATKSKDVIELQKKLDALLKKDREEDREQAQQLQKLEDKLAQSERDAATQAAIQKAVQEALSRQAATMPQYAQPQPVYAQPQFMQQPMYAPPQYAQQPFPGYAQQFAPQAQPMPMPQPAVYASQAMPQLSPEDYAALQLPTALSGLVF